MSDDENPLEFSAKDLMPDWAQESASAPRERRQPPREDRNDRGGKGRGDRRRHDGPSGGRDRRGGGGYGGRDDRRGGRDDRRGGGGRGRDQHRGGPRGRGDRRGGDQRNRPPEEKPLEGVKATLEPTPAAVAGLAKLIRDSLRAYPLADLAKMILKGRDRYQVRFRSEEGGPDLYFCETDGSLWASKEEAVNHLLNSSAIESFYEVEIVEVEAPAGNFSVVAVCGMSGKILGPPNHHEYQASVTRLHADRFSHMPIERFKSRITMESGEEVIEKWKEQVSQVKHYRVKPDEPELTQEERAEGSAEDSAEEVEEVQADETVGSEEAIAERSPAVDESSESEAEVVDGETVSPSEESAEVQGESDAEESSGETGEEVPETEVSGEEAAAVVEEAEPVAEEAPVSPAEDVVLKSARELAEHFKQNFAESAIVETRDAVVSGNVPAKSLSRGLLVHLKQESEKLRRGFPLPMIQALCRAFEKQGLKFFKRGKKALHVSVVRPRAIGESTSLTEQVQAIVDYLIANPRSKVVDLLDALAEDFTKPEQKKGAPTEELELTDGAKSVLTDLRWLAAEGYVIEFPDTCVVIGKQPRPPEAGAPQKKAAKKKVVAEKPEAEEEAKVTPEAETEVAGTHSSDESEATQEVAEEQSAAEESPVEEEQTEEAAEVEGASEIEASAAEKSESTEESSADEEGKTEA